MEIMGSTVPAGICASTEEDRLACARRLSELVFFTVP